MRNLRIFITGLIVCLTYVGAQAEETQANTKKFDPSNAGNLYTQINTGFEFKNVHGDYNIYGLRVNGQYAINANNMIFFEVPLLYNDQTRKFGLSDIRIRYYVAAARNMSKTFTFLIPFVDLTIPTGSYTRGLGTGRWSVGAGVAVGVKVNKRFSLYPGLSYVYVTKDRVKLPLDYHSNGILFQLNASLILTKKFYVFINPIFSYTYGLDSWHTTWYGELNFNYIIKPSKFKVNAGWYPDFTNKTNQFRAGATFYF